MSNLLPFRVEIEAVYADGSMRLFTYSSAYTLESIRQICIHAADTVCFRQDWASDDSGKPSADAIARQLSAGMTVLVNHPSGRHSAGIRLTPRKVFDAES